jgi:hypothetical protein
MASRRTGNGKTLALSAQVRAVHEDSKGYLSSSEG